MVQLFRNFVEANARDCLSFAPLHRAARRLPPDRRQQRPEQSRPRGAKGELKRWNVATGELISTTTVGDADTRLDALAWSAKAGLLVVASRDSLHGLALADLRHLGEVKLPANCLTLASSPDGNKIAAGLSDGCVAGSDVAAPPAAPAATKPGTTGPKR